jgi:hypothetical protein
MYLYCKRKFLDSWCVKSHNSCRDLFKRIEISALPCEYIFSLINFITNNKELFQAIGEVHSVNIRQQHYLHKPAANLSCFQKSTYYARIKFFNNLPSDLKSFMKEKARFKTALKRYLNTCSFYSLDEYLLSKKCLICLKVL